MPLSEPGTISRFVDVYKGIEDFYFLNRNGELGYIQSGALKSVKETFPQLRDRQFLRANPEFLAGLEDFLRDLGSIPDTYTLNRPGDLELGYILPASDQYLWRTASLVLHKHVLETLKTDHESRFQSGAQDLAETGRDLSRIMGVRSIHQGLDELIQHRDAFGEHRYFPVLYVRPEQPDNSDSDAARSRICVLNLSWRGRGLDASRHRGKRARGTRELIFRALRENLAQRGAIDYTRRGQKQRSIA